MRVCLFEDGLVSDLEPLALTRPVFDLLCGCTTLAEKQLRWFAATASGCLVRPALARRTAERRPRVNDLDWLRSGELPIVLANGRWLPPCPGFFETDRPCVGLVDDEVAYAVVTPAHLGDCTPATIEDCLEHWKARLPAHPAGGHMVHHLWDLVDANGGEIALDAWLSAPSRPRKTQDLPEVQGPMDRLHVAPSARVEPMVLADTTGGPVVIDDDALVTAFTRLEGPCYIGPGTQVFGAKVRAGTSFGPACRIGGEVEASVVLGHSNKYHEGFLGHAYLGEWINLGAGTHNSDLRNDYGEVSVAVNGRLTRTGRHKVGCFLGDHVKSGIGSLLNTGTNAGPFAALLPTGGFLPKYVPAFASVIHGSLRDNADLPALLKTAATMMSRRGREMTAALTELYENLFEETARGRRAAIREADMRRLRRTA